jgi:hypothetical protein
MTFNVRINPNPETRIIAKVASTQGAMNPQTLTIKNQLREYQINSIQDLPDVAETDVSDGSTLVFNSNTNLYEVKPLDVSAVTGVIDGGEF